MLVLGVLLFLGGALATLGDAKASGAEYCRLTWCCWEKTSTNPQLTKQRLTTRSNYLLWYWDEGPCLVPRAPVSLRADVKDRAIATLKVAISSSYLISRHVCGTQDLSKYHWILFENSLWMGWVNFDENIRKWHLLYLSWSRGIRSNDLKTRGETFLCW